MKVYICFRIDLLRNKGKIYLRSCYNFIYFIIKRRWLKSGIIISINQLRNTVEVGRNLIQYIPFFPLKNTKNKYAVSQYFLFGIKAKY